MEESQRETWHGIFAINFSID